MRIERIPCLLEAFEDGSLQIVPVRSLKLRPGEWAEFTANPPEAVVHRVWFGRRWYVALRAHLAGERGPKLEVTQGEE